MKRRAFLSVLAALPFGKWFVPKPEPVAHVIDTVIGSNKDDPFGHGSHVNDIFRALRVTYRITHDGKTWSEVTATEAVATDSPGEYEFHVKH